MRCDQHGNQPLRMRRDQLLQNHAPLGDEQAVTPDEVAFPDVSVGLKAWIINLMDWHNHDVAT